MKKRKRREREREDRQEKSKKRERRVRKKRKGNDKVFRIFSLVRDLFILPSFLLSSLFTVFC